MPAEVADFIPEDVNSSFGGATGDLWADDWQPTEPAPHSGAAPAEDEPDTDYQAPTPRQASAAAKRQTAPAAPKRAPRGAAKPTATQPAFAPKVVSSDSVQGKAFAEVTELFPGKVVEVLPLRQATDEDASSGAPDVTEVTFADGYDDPTGAELEQDDA